MVKCSNCKQDESKYKGLCIKCYKYKNSTGKDRVPKILKAKCFCNKPSICIQTFQYDGKETTAWVCKDHDNAIRDNGPDRWICAGKDCTTRPHSDMDYCGPCNTNKIQTQFERDQEIYTKETGYTPDMFNHHIDFRSQVHLWMKQKSDSFYD